MEAFGHRAWIVAGGHVPLQSTGDEPAFTSFDQLCMVNTGDGDAHVKITFLYADREPVGPYEIDVAGRRVRHVRINDLIDPEAVRLDVDYACVIEASVPIVVQFTRQDTRQAENALFGMLAFPLGE